MLNTKFGIIGKPIIPKRRAAGPEGLRSPVFWPKASLLNTTKLAGPEGALMKRFPKRKTRPVPI